MPEITKPIDCRFECFTGEKIVIRLLNAAQKELVIDKLGMTANSVFFMRFSRQQFSHRPNGERKNCHALHGASLLNQTALIFQPLKTLWKFDTM